MSATQTDDRIADLQAEVARLAVDVEEEQADEADLHAAEQRLDDARREVERSRLREQERERREAERRKRAEEIERQRQEIERRAAAHRQIECSREIDALLLDLDAEISGWLDAARLTGTRTARLADWLSWCMSLHFPHEFSRPRHHPHRRPVAEQDAESLVALLDEEATDE